MYTNFHGEKISGHKPTDMILRNYFPDYSFKGVMIEIGAYDPIEISNSYHFEQNGWDTYCIEANPIGIEKFNMRKNRVINYAVANYNQDRVDFDLNIYHSASYSSLQLDKKLCEKLHGNPCMKKIKVNVRTLNYILETYLSHIQKINILTIDVEGGELGVLEGFDIQKWKPDLIFVEDHHYNDGKSDVCQFLLKNGYYLDHKIEYNCFYKQKPNLK